MNGPAFPHPGSGTPHYPGLTMRDYLMQAEPVAYEFRMFPEGATASDAWSPCSKEHHEMYIRTPMFENWVYETRALFAAPQAVPAVCEWTQDTDFEMGDTYHSSCGELWSFIDGGPKENRVSYCHHCGKPVKLAAAPKGSI